MGRILVSACLAGEPCRYDGGHKLDERIRKLVEEGGATPVCPEVLGGLPTPRKPYERVGDRVVAQDGQDVTAEFAEGARRGVGLAREHGCALAVLQPRSPSCGCGLVHDGTFRGVLAPGDGVFTEALREAGVATLSVEDWTPE